LEIEKHLSALDFVLDCKDYLIRLYSMHL